MDDLLQQGVSAFRAGKKDESRKLFIAAIKQNPNDERAWGWMYNISNNDKERTECLKQMLRINPKNEKAGQLLNDLTSFQHPLEPPTNADPQIVKPVKQQVQNQTDSHQHMKPCPYCAEEIQAAAMVCRYCGHNLTKTSMTISLLLSHYSSNGLRLILLIAIIVIAVVATAAGVIYAMPLLSQSSIRDISMRFLTQEVKDNEHAPDAIFRKVDFYLLWCTDYQKQECKYDLENIVIRDGANGEKDVTLFVTKSFKDITPPTNNFGAYNFDAPHAQWTVSSVTKKERWEVFYTFETLNNKWVLRCAEAANQENEYHRELPDMCKGK